MIEASSSISPTPQTGWAVSYLCQSVTGVWPGSGSVLGLPGRGARGTPAQMDAVVFSDSIMGTLEAFQEGQTLREAVGDGSDV